MTAPADLVPGARVTLSGRARAGWSARRVHPRGGAGLAHAARRRGGAAAASDRGAAHRAGAPGRCPRRARGPRRFTATPETVTLTVAARGLAARAHRRGLVLSRRAGAPSTTRRPSRRGSTPGGDHARAWRGDSCPGRTAGPIDGVLVITERLDGGTVAPGLHDPGHARRPRRRRRVRRCCSAVALALAGGLLLNLMPCVLPVLSVKALGLVQPRRPGRRRRCGDTALAYTAGVLVSFAAVAGALLALRAGGEQIGWGFQLQSPLVVTLLAYVLFAMALACRASSSSAAGSPASGQALAARPGYAAPSSRARSPRWRPRPAPRRSWGRRWASRVTQPAAPRSSCSRRWGSASPCPISLLTLVPALARAPAAARAPGWSGSSRLLAFPLYASVAWLVWVLSQQAGPTAWRPALGGLVLIAFAAWLYPVCAARAPRRGAAPAWPRWPRSRWPRWRSARSPCAAPAVGRHPPAAPGGAAWEPSARAAWPSCARRARPVFVELHRRLVHHLSRERARGAPFARGGRGLRAARAWS